MAAPVTELYEIKAGTYTEWGGFAGMLTYDLPYYDQAFIELTIDGDRNTAEMQILGSELNPFEFLFFGSALTEGTVDGDSAIFRGTSFTPFFHEPGDLDYAIILNGDLLSLQGELTWEPPGFDIPSRFFHSDVEASLVPEPKTVILLACGIAIFMLRSGWRGRQSFLTKGG